MSDHVAWSCALGVRHGHCWRPPRTRVRSLQQIAYCSAYPALSSRSRAEQKSLRRADPGIPKLDPALQSCVYQADMAPDTCLIMHIRHVSVIYETDIVY